MRTAPTRRPTRTAGLTALVAGLLAVAGTVPALAAGGQHATAAHPKAEHRKAEHHHHHHEAKSASAKKRHGAKAKQHGTKARSARHTPAGTRSVTRTGAAAVTTRIHAGSSRLHQQWSAIDLGDGYAAVSSAAGTSEGLRFVGDSITVSGVLAHDGGLATVLLDGRPQRTPVSFYAPLGDLTDGTSQTVYHHSWSTAGSHTLRIVVRGRPAVGSSAAWVRLDSYTVTDGAVSQTYQEAAHDATGTVSDSFAPVVATDAAGGLALVTSYPAASGSAPAVWARATGKVFVFELCKGPTSGYAKVSFDSYSTVVNLYSSYSHCGPVVQARAKKRSTHTLRVSAVGRVPAGSTGTRTGFDAFAVH